MALICSQIAGNRCRQVAMVGCVYCSLSVAAFGTFPLVCTCSLTENGARLRPDRSKQATEKLASTCIPIYTTCTLFRWYIYA